MDMTCPKCSGPMRTYERNGVHVDQCADCRGIFLDRGELERLGAGVTLTPGMPAEALIVTRERTLLDYLLAPVADVFRRGMRES